MPADIRKVFCVIIISHVIWLIVRAGELFQGPLKIWTEHSNFPIPCNIKNEILGSVLSIYTEVLGCKLILMGLSQNLIFEISSKLTCQKSKFIHCKAQNKINIRNEVNL